MEDLFDWFEQQLTTKEQEVEAGHQVAHTEDADPRGPRDKDDCEDKPEHVAKHDDLQHVQVGPKEEKTIRQHYFSKNKQAQQVN